tara:strand:+ start:306 stop:479 length:174 start_codon:yes stop_codon:yes gene_type:complete
MQERKVLDFNTKVDNGVVDDLATETEIEPKVFITVRGNSLRADGDVILDLKSHYRGS